MNQFRVRIGRVISKGGADLKIIDGKFEWHDRAGECCDKLTGAAEKVIEYFPDLAGYVVIGWDMLGRYTLGYRNTIGAIPHRLLPTFVMEAVRDQMTMNDVTEELREGRWQ